MLVKNEKKKGKGKEKKTRKTNRAAVTGRITRAAAGEKSSARNAGEGGRRHYCCYYTLIHRSRIVSGGGREPRGIRTTRGDDVATIRAE